MSAQMIEVPMKFELVRNGEVVETRRTRLVNPSFEAVAAVGAGWSRGKSTTLQYVDDEGDLVTMDTEGEWCECMRLWRSGVANKALVVRLVLPSLEGGKGRGPCWWRKAAERCRSRSRSRSRSGSRSPCKRRQSPCRRGWGFMMESIDAEEPEKAPTASQAVVVEKILKKLHGEDTMVALASGTVDAKALGCKGWLSVKVLEDGEVDLDVKVRKLYNMLHQKGLDSLHSKDVEAVDWFTLCTELEPSRCVGWYNLSCALLVLQVPLQKGEAEKEQVVSQALEALEGAVKNGYSKWRHMATDPDLEEVRKNPRFLALFPERIRDRVAARLSDDESPFSKCGRGQRRGHGHWHGHGHKHGHHEGHGWGGMHALRGFMGGMYHHQQHLQNQQPATHFTAGEQCKGCDYMTTGVAPGHCCWACMSGTSQHGPMCMRQQQPQQPEKAHTDVVEGETAVEEAHMDVVEEAVQEQCSGCNISLPEGVAGMCCEQCANNNKREEKEPEHLLWVPEVPPLSPVEALLPFQSSVAGSSPVLVDVPECEGTSICGSIESLTHELVDPVPAPELELDEQDEVPVPVEVEAPAPAEVEYAQQITALQGMGFPVDGTLLAALKVNNGDLAKAVNMLLM
eukprot:TRINITY_DN99_c0_g1_i11.p1 TRINITY_DN99_c0_g1~~TRINITY_DN99_c0_g1_i11.p1  ORF type:complete len:624 (+),score=176.88 TRINITY_DN99_c0_g1_i11:54-1925(+)